LVARLACCFGGLLDGCVCLHLMFCRTSGGTDLVDVSDVPLPAGAYLVRTY
jgi:hypothetical protein